MLACWCMSLLVYHVFDVLCDWCCLYDVMMKKSLNDFNAMLLVTCLCSTFFTLKFLYGTCCNCCQADSLDTDGRKVFLAELNFSLVEVLANGFQIVFADSNIEEGKCVDVEIWIFALICCLGGFMQLFSFGKNLRGCQEEGNQYYQNNKCVNICGLIIACLALLGSFAFFAHATNLQFCLRNLNLN